MKSIIQQLGMIVTMLLSFHTVLAYDFEVDGIAYTITSFSDLTCSVDASDVTYEGEIIVPSEVLFKGKTLTVTSISNSAFKDSHITSIQIPATVIDIESSAFANCENLYTIELQEGLQSIGSDAFNGCVNLTKIDFPTTLRTIGSASFANCKTLSQIVLTTGITSLGSSAFMNCENVTKASLATISILENNVFNGCINLQEIEWSNNLDQIKNQAFANCNFTKFIIPNSVTTIGTNILLNNKNLESFTIGNGISEIQSNPIAGCPMVSELIIADGVEPLTLNFSSGNYSIVQTDEATSSNEYWKYKYYYTRPGAFSDSTFETVYIGRPLSNPSYTRDYGGSSWCSDYWEYYYSLPPFYGNKNIKVVTIGPNVSSLNGVGFSSKYRSFYYGWLENCSNLELVTISGLYDIPEYFARNAISLRTIELPNTTCFVGDQAFYNCASLETIMFGSNLSRIGTGALGNCNALTSIYCKSNTPPTYSTEFNKNIYLNCKLYIPFETEQSYKSVSPWNNFWDITESHKCVSEFKVGDLIYYVTAGNNVIVKGNVVADECGIVIPSRVEYYSSDYNVIGIGASAFKGASINSIVIPGCVSNIYNDAFNGCSKLKSITMEYSDNSVIIGHKSALQLSNSITPFPNATTVDEKRTGFRNGYYNGLFYGLPIERVIINRDIELPKYYERTVGTSTSSYPTVYNDIVYYPPFYGLTNLKYVEIGENVSAICKNQIEAVVSTQPTTMEYTNFGQCDNIEVVVSNNPNAPVGGGFSQKVYENANLFLPNGGENSYESDELWKYFLQKTPATFVPIENISFITDEYEMGFNESQQLMPIINPEVASIQKLRWASSSPSIAQISDDGIVSTSEEEGVSFITATSTDGTDKSITCKIIVRKSDAGIEDILYSEECEKFVVYNLQGILVLKTEDYERVKHLPTGIYFVNGKKTIINRP